MPQKILKTSKSTTLNPLITPSKRLKAWERVREMWKNRKNNPIKELEKIRTELDRELPSLH